MKVLVVDDDPLIRLVLQRLLIRQFACAVTECENGLEALVQLERQSFTFVLLDNKMPVMSGVETLRVLRQSARWSDVPVVMVSAVKDDESVAEVIRLGISDYLTKPLRPERVVTRLTSVIQSLGRHALRCHDEGVDQRPDARRPLLIADGNAEFRHSFQTILSPYYPVVEAPLGTGALKLCMGTPPTALFVGADLGVFSPEMLVNKLRDLPALDETRIFKVVARTPGVEIEPVSRRFDGVLQRTYVPDQLLDQVRRLLSSGRGVDDSAGLLRALRSQLVTAVEQAFGMMLGADAAWEDPSGLPEQRCVEATVQLVSLDGKLDITLALDCTVETAGEITRRMLSMEGEAVSDDDNCSSIAELTNIVAGRLQNHLIEFGVAARFSLPRAIIRAQARPVQLGSADCIVMHATAPVAAIALRIRLERICKEASSAA